MLALLLACPGMGIAADDPCKAFKWDLSRERTLFASAPGPAVDGNASPPASIGVEQAVDLALRPQADVRFPAPPTKPMLVDGAFAGVVNFRVENPGIHRVAIDAPFWIDVLDGNDPLVSVDFGGPGSGCPPPSKVVTYDLPAGRLLTLQLSGATEQAVRVTITRVP